MGPDRNGQAKFTSKGSRGRVTPGHGEWSLPGPWLGICLGFWKKSKTAKKKKIKNNISKFIWKLTENSKNPYSVCNDDSTVPHIIEQYENASTKMLDRWSVLTYDGPLFQEHNSSGSSSETRKRDFLIGLMKFTVKNLCLNLSLKILPSYILDQESPFVWLV